MIYEKILKEKLRLEKRIEELQAQIEKLPAGKLICPIGNGRNGT